MSGNLKRSKKKNMVRTLPKNCKDWHEDLVRCAEAKFNKRARENKKDYNEWFKALNLLRNSEDPIYIQPTGEGKVGQLYFSVLCLDYLNVLHSHSIKTVEFPSINF